MIEQIKTENQEVKSIYITGVSPVTLGQDEEGLYLFASSDAKVVLRENELFISTPKQNGVNITGFHSMGIGNFYFNNTSTNASVTIGDNMTFVNGKLVSGSNIKTYSNKREPPPPLPPKCDTLHRITSRKENLITIVKHDGTGGVRLNIRLHHSCKLTSTGIGNLICPQLTSYRHLMILNKGMGDIEICTNEIDIFESKLSGTGDVQFTEKATIQSADLCLSGTGDYNLKDSSINNVVSKLSGTGNFRNMHIIRSGKLSIGGTGKYDCTASPGADIMKSMTGVGKFNVRIV